MARGRRGKVNQQRIAAELKLSQATVSRSLKNDPAIHPQTRALVLDAAARMGYQTSLSLREPGRRRRDTLLQVGVLVQDSDRGSGLTVTRLIAGISSAAQKLKVAVSIHHVPADRAGSWHRPSDRPLILEQGLVRGLLLLRRFDSSVIAEIALQMPCVSIVHSYLPAPVDCVAAADSFHLGYCVRRLVELGHRRIALIGSQPTTTWARRRLLGYRDAVEQFHADTDPALVRLDWPEGNEPSREEAVLTAVLQAGPTAITCTGDTVAVGVCRHLQARNLEPGRDIAITGHDGWLANPSGLDLATIRVPFEELGVAALQLLKLRLSNPGMPCREVLVHGAFHEGDTLCPPGGATPTT